MARRVGVALSWVLMSACVDGRPCASSRDCGAREICLTTHEGRTCRPSPPSQALPLRETEPREEQPGDGSVHVGADEPTPPEAPAPRPRLRAGTFSSATRTLRGSGFTLTFGARPASTSGTSRRDP